MFAKGEGKIWSLHGMGMVINNFHGKLKWGEFDKPVGPGHRVGASIFGICRKGDGGGCSERDPRGKSKPC